jgi:signal-transduction protein with cAMP-binding, CBS, and nucleotidyltransferase domain
MKALNSLDQNNAAINLIEFLMSMPEFNTLTHDQLEMLDKTMRIDQYPNGHKFKSNDNIYLIIEGDVAERYKKENGLMQLNHVHSGELFGLYSLIDNSKQTATCSSVGSVSVASLPRTAFELLINSNLPLGKHFRRIVNVMNEVECGDDYDIDTNLRTLTEQHWNDSTVINVGQGH